MFIIFCNRCLTSHNHTNATVSVCVHKLAIETTLVLLQQYTGDLTKFHNFQEIRIHKDNIFYLYHFEDGPLWIYGTCGLWKL